mmetsp:Transcript_11758/g.18856  ORF Transcript_11758/g.18856 Transcript_11758/m.18856 type:complete len:91 (+) Transcript_11758:350-622(+)
MFFQLPIPNNSTSHKSVSIHAVRTGKIMNSSGRIADSHVTNAGEAPRDAWQGPPNNGVGIEFPLCIDLKTGFFSVAIIHHLFQLTVKSSM